MIRSGAFADPLVLVVALDRRRSYLRRGYTDLAPIPKLICRHDDITYESIGKAFGLKIKLYDEAYQRMRKLSKPRPGEGPFNWDEDSPAKKAKLRMVELPTDDTVPLEKQFLFPREDLWVPVAVVNGNVHILPGVPRLCQCRPPLPRAQAMNVAHC